MASAKSNGTSGTPAKTKRAKTPAPAQKKSRRPRRVNGGDTARTLTPEGIEGFVVSEAVQSARQAKEREDAQREAHGATRGRKRAARP